MRRTVPAWISMAAVVCLGAADDGRLELVPGDDLSAFELVKLGTDSVSVKAGEIRLTGKPNGFLATKESRRDYVLDFEWMFERPADLKSETAFRGNGGLLVHVVEPLKVWPRSIEVQIASEDAGHIFAIAGGKFKGRKDPAAQDRARRPIGAWNHMVVTCRAGRVECVLNGERIDSGEGADPASGRIAWQSEGSAMRLRRIRVKDLP